MAKQTPEELAHKHVTAWLETNAYQSIMEAIAGAIIDDRRQFIRFSDEDLKIILEMFHTIQGFSSLSDQELKTRKRVESMLENER